MKRIILTVISITLFIALLYEILNMFFYKKMNCLFFLIIPVFILSLISLFAITKNSITSKDTIYIHSFYFGAVWGIIVGTLDYINSTEGHLFYGILFFALLSSVVAEIVSIIINFIPFLKDRVKLILNAVAVNILLFALFSVIRSI